MHKQRRLVTDISTKVYASLFIYRRIHTYNYLLGVFIIWIYGENEKYTEKITLISLFGPLLLIISRVIDVVKKISVLGFDDDYYCNLSTDAKCSLLYYIFKSDDALISYVGIVLSFIFLFATTSFIFFLIKLHKEHRFNLFWVLISITALVLIACLPVVTYIQLIS